MATPLRALACRCRCRAFSTTHGPLSAFPSGPAPPRLPRDEQAIFEKLQKASTGAFSQPQHTATLQSHTRSNPLESSPGTAGSAADADATDAAADAATAQPSTPTMPLHPNMRRGAPPEFEGDVNPATGEVGGPKNEPLRWGSTGDWSYHGRVSDF